jgi:long-chain acyl-CoA synthetase
MERTWLKNYPKNVPHDINPDIYKSIVEVFEKSVEKWGDRPAFASMGAVLSFRDMDRLSAQFASFLQNDLKLQKGDRLAIQMPNILQYPIALFGALRAGVVIVNTNPLYTAREMKHQFTDSGAKAILILANFADKLEEVLPDTDIEHVIITELGDMFSPLKKLLVNSAVKYIKKMVPKYNIENAIGFNEALSRGLDNPMRATDVDLHDLAFLQYTGGTTGIAKGAMLTHRNIVANMEQVTAWMSPSLVEGQEKAICALPLYHIFSLTVNCFGFFKYGALNVLIANPRDIPGFVKELNKWEFTLVSGVNTLFNALMNHEDFEKIDFSHLKLSVAGAMTLQKAVCERWRKLTGTTIVEGYGLTESSPVVSCNPVDGNDIVGTIGMPLPSTEIMVADELGKEVPLGEPGELCVGGPQVMKGYWKKDDETKKVFLEGGWLKTGDVAQADEKGYFRIVDRKKDMILVSGFNVFPNEIEGIAVTHPGVLEAAAIGVPDDKSGEAVKLFVVKKDSSLTEKDLKDFCRENLTAYKVPRYIEFRTELPKTNVGKILRMALREPQAQ